MLSAYEGVSGVLFDLPEVVLGANQVFRRAGVSSRATWVGGDFFSAVPHDGGLYLLKSVLLVVVGGRERTEAEYRELLERSGFALSRVIPTNSLLSS